MFQIKTNWSKSKEDRCSIIIILEIRIITREMNSRLISMPNSKCPKEKACSLYQSDNHSRISICRQEREIVSRQLRVWIQVELRPNFWKMTYSITKNQLITNNKQWQEEIGNNSNSLKETTLEKGYKIRSWYRSDATMIEAPRMFKGHSKLNILISNNKRITINRTCISFGNTKNW